MKNYKRKKNKKKLTKKQIIILIIAVFIFATLAAAISAVITRNTSGDMLSTEEDIDIQALVEKLGCEYISDCVSDIAGFDINVYMTFEKDTIVDGNSQQPYYDIIIQEMAVGTLFKNLILIDTSRDLTIKITCTDTAIKSIMINDLTESDYFESLLSEYAKKNPLEVELTSMTVNSQELQNLINNDWVTQAVNFGTKESTFNKYDIYFDEGIEVRTVNKKAYNIVFTSKYTENVVGGLKVGTDLDTVKERFGISYEETGAIYGYKTKDFYIYFSSDQISIYPNHNYGQDEYIEFENLLAEYNKQKDINDFMDKLTDIWPDYDIYNYDTYYLEIDYTLKGVRISYSSTGSEGIQIYENYNGSLKETQTDYDEVYYKIDENLIINNESQNIMQNKTIIGDAISANEYEENAEENLKISNVFFLTYSVVDSNRYKNISVMCKTGEYPHTTLDDTIIMSDYIWADDTHLIYNVQGQGIYMYNAVERETLTLLEGDETYNITDYDRDKKELTYDGKTVLIKY